MATYGNSATAVLEKTVMWTMPGPPDGWRAAGMAKSCPQHAAMVRAMFQTVPRGWFYRKSGTSSLTWSVPLFLDHSLSEEPILSLPEYSGE